MLKDLKLDQIQNTNALSLEDHINLLEKEIVKKTTDFRKLRQNLFSLTRGLEKIDKADKLAKMVNDNELSFKISKLERNLSKNQHGYLNSLNNMQGELKEFSEETTQMDAILDDLEKRLNTCQDKIGIFD